MFVMGGRVKDDDVDVKTIEENVMSTKKILYSTSVSLSLFLSFFFKQKKNNHSSFFPFYLY